MRLSSLTIVLFALAFPSCARSQGSVNGEAKPQQSTSRPLAALAAQKLVILPVQYLREADSLGWSEQAGSTREYLRQVDSEIELAAKERGVDGMWVFSEQLARSARRNPGYAPDPYNLAAQSLRPGVRRREQMLREPLATQLRSIVAFTEARYALVPVELRFEKLPSGGRAILRLVLVDARSSRPVWAVDVASEPADQFSGAVAASLAEHLADLIGER